jgi:hypothetical protein
VFLKHEQLADFDVMRGFLGHFCFSTRVETIISAFCPRALSFQSLAPHLWSSVRGGVAAMPRPTAAVVDPVVAAALLNEVAGARRARAAAAQQRHETRRLRASMWAAVHIESFPSAPSPEAVLAQTLLEASSATLNASLWAADPT